MEQVVRFADPEYVEFCGEFLSVVDLFRTWDPLQATVMQRHVVIDEATHHRIRTLEAALASRFAIMHTPGRNRTNKYYDFANFRRLVRANYDRIDRPAVRRLADLVWNGAADEIERFIEIAPTDEPFPI